MFPEFHLKIRLLKLPGNEPHIVDNRKSNDINQKNNIGATKCQRNKQGEATTESSKYQQ